MIVIQSCQILLGAGQIDVGREDIDGGRFGLPDGNGVVSGATTLVGDGHLGSERIVEGVIDVERQGIRGLAGCGNRSDVFGDGPGMEVDLGLGAEDGIPIGAGRGIGLAHGLEDLGRDRAIKELVGIRAVIADGCVCAGLVLDLDHQDRSLWVSRL